FFTADGSRLLIFAAPMQCRALDLRTQKLTALIQSNSGDGMGSMSASADGRFIAAFTARASGSVDDGLVVGLWDGKTGTRLRDLWMPGDRDGELGFPRDGRRVATALWGSRRAEGSGGGAVVPAWSWGVWDTAPGKFVRPPWDTRTDAACLALSPDGRSVATGSGDGAIVVWEVATGIERARFTGHPAGVRCVAFSPCGRYLASAGLRAPVLIWDLWAVPSGPAPAPAELWSMLGRHRTAMVAMQRLAAVPDTAIALFREHLHAVTPVSEERLRQLLADLDQPRYAARAAALA